eukprot:TRINITY_DN11023_c0_g1_i1.p1 TRINITY_DN11023_c0_g1~~TRINITY_DN11023_c0_g1_i1.p1  ORF type:complete len:161 (-),score=51.89 TRINITY_DN11023_c0_g1_i1:101-538(-)
MSNLEELFGKTLVNAKNESVSVDTLKDKYIGLYFSAHWCPPCRGFTPKLVEFYNNITSSGKPFEIVFVSSDKSPKQMFEYMNDKNAPMPWLAVPHGDDRVDQLSDKFEVAGIPKLVVLSPDGKVKSPTAREQISSKGTAAWDAWQ